MTYQIDQSGKVESTNKLTVVAYANGRIKVDSVVIDREYFGHEAIIKGMIIQLLNKNGKNVPEIQFDYIGKASQAHKVALDVFRGDREADLVVTAKDVLRLLY